MSTLNNKKIILAITGGIAVYKSAILLRLLIKQGAEVRVVMTESAKEFVTPLTFQALSGNVVRSELFDQDAESGMGHIELAQWADQIIIAPATANTIAKISCGMADNLLTTLCLATRAPLLIAPAMNQKMWHHPTTQENIKKLAAQSSVFLCGPAQGEQACGDTGFGRMEEPQTILEYCLDCLYEDIQQSIALKGKTVLITAGPTIEDIDPVRYISNRSSGKMGYAIARAASASGARVILVSGPVNIEAPQGVEIHQVRSAQKMHKKVFSLVEQADIFIATAAVADYRPITKNHEKIKKTNDRLNIEFVKNPDILSAVSDSENKPFCVGFAAETNQMKTYAIDKLKRKNLDMIVANQVGDDKGFEKDNNELSLYWFKENALQEKILPFASKINLARQLIKEISFNFKDT